MEKSSLKQQLRDTLGLPNLEKYEKIGISPMYDETQVIKAVSQWLTKERKVIESWKDIRYTEGYFKKQLIDELLKNLSIEQIKTTENQK